MKDYLLRLFLSPGDHLMLTGFVRDLHKAYPGIFRTNVLNNFPAIYQSNPLLDPTLVANDKVEIIQAHYNPAIDQANTNKKRHFSAGFHLYFREKYGFRVPLTDMRPDVYLTDEEKAKPLVDGDYWVIFAGGKTDFPAKVWDRAWSQQVVDLLPEIKFVQVGGKGDVGDHVVFHAHHDLHGDNLVNMVGKTTLREMMILIYHSKGVVCPVTCGMHLAAAFNKPCVVIAGGREGYWWENYTREAWLDNVGTEPPADFVEHRYLHTIGALGCCRYFGCWLSGTGDMGRGRDCTNLVAGPTSRQPRCLAMITPQQVVKAILSYNQLADTTAIERRLEQVQPFQLTPLKISVKGPPPPRKEQISPEGVTVFMQFSGNNTDQHHKRLMALLTHMPAGFFLHAVFDRESTEQTKTWFATEIKGRIDRVTISHIHEADVSASIQFFPITPWTLWLGPKTVITGSEFYSALTEAMVSGRSKHMALMQCHVIRLSPTDKSRVDMMPWNKNRPYLTSAVATSLTSRDTFLINTPQADWAFGTSTLFQTCGWPIRYNQTMESRVLFAAHAHQSDVDLRDFRTGIHDA